MAISVGTDIVELARFEKAAQSKRLIKRCFTEAEQQYAAERSVSSVERYAGLFAAKEAFGKAVGTGISFKLLQEVEVLHEPAGRPYLHLLGETAARYAALSFSLSISHSGNYAVATVLAYSDVAAQVERLTAGEAEDLHVR